MESCDSDVLVWKKTPTHNPSLKLKVQIIYHYSSTFYESKNQIYKFHWLSQLFLLILQIIWEWY